MQVKIDEADPRLSELLQAMRRGEEVILVEGDKVIARLVPIRSGFRLGGLEGRLGESPDFLEPMSKEDLRDWEGRA